MEAFQSVKVGDILKRLREQNGITQDFLANLLNIKRQTYSAWERNVSSPDINTIVFLADYYGVDLEYIVGKSEIPRKRFSDGDLFASRYSVLSPDKKRLLETIMNEFERANKQQSATGGGNTTR